MRVRVFFPVAIAIALAASLAPDGVARAPTRHPPGHAGVTRPASTGPRIAANPSTGVAPGGTVYRRPWPATPIVAARYSYQPAFAVPAIAAADECADFGTGCTDEQNCDLWGIDCSADPQAEDPVPADAGSDSSPAAAP